MLTLLPVDPEALPRSEKSDRSSARGPAFRIYRSVYRDPYWALSLRFEVGRATAETWLSVADARWLADRLTAHADAFEAQLSGGVP